jgi:hypothetical protein
MVGLPWEQHGFLRARRTAADIEKRVRAAVRTCAGHPALLAYAIGNEIPASIVRWAGPRAVEGFLERLYETVKAEDPGALCTYVNFPRRSTCSSASSTSSATTSTSRRRRA